MDPSNITLLRQKQDLLNQSIAECREKLTNPAPIALVPARAFPVVEAGRTCKTASFRKERFISCRKNAIWHSTRQTVRIAAIGVPCRHARSGAAARMRSTVNTEKKMYEAGTFCASWLESVQPPNSGGFFFYEKGVCIWFRLHFSSSSSAGLCAY